MISEKITYLDGLRGIACVVVVSDHFLSTFDPATIYGSQFPSHLDNLEMLFLEQTPIRNILQGLFAVCIFFVLIGYVLTQKYYKTREQKIIISGAARR